MAIGTKLNLQQTHKLVMTPELQQSISLLQLSSLELQEVIQAEMEENPFLDEIVDDKDGPKVELTSDGKDPQEEGKKELDSDLKDEFNIDWDNYFDDASDIGYNNERETKDPGLFIENTATQPTTLLEHLARQLRLSVVSEEDYKIGEMIVGSIDENGYLTSSTHEIAELSGCDPKRVEEVLKVVQAFEPLGVGARNLVECLSIQLENTALSEEDVSLAKKLIEEHTEELQGGINYNQLAGKLGVTPERLSEVSEVVSRLDPKPGRKYDNSEPEYVIPDIVVKEVNGNYVIINNDWLPRLRISPAYRKILKGGALSSETDNNYLREKLRSAIRLIKSIEQRRKTLYNVTKSIFEVQREFLDKGARHLKPLTLREIADMIGMHESTVSRVTTNKYVQTPRGIFELKYFFNSRIESNTPDGISSLSVKETIKELIESEDPERPLSDQEIKEVLKEKGFNIARRTISKYRDELKIAPSNKRRKRMHSLR
jgi:RNA polymerase sigma-54 factor